MDKKQLIGQRILQYLETKGHTRNSLCKANGWDPSKINRQLKGETALSADTIEGFVFTYNDINLSWLLLGVGPMCIDDPIDAIPPAPGTNAIRADHVADIDPQPAPVNYFVKDAQQPQAPQAPADITSALDLIRSQQQIIETQARMLETLLKKQNQ